MQRRASVFVGAVLLLVDALLMLAGICRLREAAHRSRCTNNLRQLAIAVHNYAGTYDRFPSATVSEPNLAPARRLSYLFEVLPFVEGCSLPPYDKTKPWDAEENRPRWYRHRSKGDEEETESYWGYYRLWLCPAHPNQPAPNTPSNAHYVGIAGIGSDAASRAIDAPGIGIFGYDRQLHFEDLKHGTSGVLLAVETQLANGLWLAGGYPTVRGLDPTGPPYLGAGGQFGGLHRGGVNAVFADGTVRFLSLDTSPQVLEAMATLAGGDRAITTDFP